MDSADTAGTVPVVVLKLALGFAREERSPTGLGVQMVKVRMLKLSNLSLVIQ